MTHISNGECTRAEEVLQETNRLFTEIGSSYGINQSRYWRAQVLFGCGEVEKAKNEAKRFVEYCRSVGEKNMQGMILFFLGLVAETGKDLQSALEYSQKSLDLAREVGSPDKLAANFASLGRLKYLRGDHDEAFHFIHDSLEIVKNGGTDVNSTSFIFLQIGGMYIENKPHIAVQLMGFSENIFQTLPNPRNSTLQKPYLDLFLPVARKKLSKDEFESAWNEGLRMRMEKAIELAITTAGR